MIEPLGDMKPFYLRSHSMPLFWIHTCWPFVPLLPPLPLVTSNPRNGGEVSVLIPLHYILQLHPFTLSSWLYLLH